MPSQGSMAHTGNERTRVAVVGTGMAGLVTAYLLNIERDRFDVHVFESGKSPSLDSASVNFRDAEKREWHIDVPMRAFTDGYYHDLKAMYDFLGIQYRRQSLRYIFSRHSTLDKTSPERPYFVHDSNRHQSMCSELSAQQIGPYLLELCFVLLCYTWFTVCCLLVPPKSSRYTGLAETLEDYLQRTMIPRRFVSLYLLPLFSAVATCSHQELLCFPASDVVNYRKSILFKDHYVVSDGVQKVEAALTHGLNIMTCSRVAEIIPSDSGYRLRISASKENCDVVTEHFFDRVILAIPPNEAASIYNVVSRQLSSLPTRTVTTAAHHLVKSEACGSTQGLEMEEIHLCSTSSFGGWTQARHTHRCRVGVTSNLLNTSILPSDTFSRSTFTRVLRTPLSKRMVDQIFRVQDTPRGSDKGIALWKNGDYGIWMAGAWCWDGMVLLEGAVVSAMRIARDFDVEIPW